MDLATIGSASTDSWTNSVAQTKVPQVDLL
jgi:hypothetical protein